MSLCPRCQGKRQVQLVAKIMVGGKVVELRSYWAECPRCEGAERWKVGEGFRGPPTGLRL